MVNDAAALALAAGAAWLAKRSPSLRHSYGLGRAEFLAALINSLGLLVLVAWLLSRGEKNLNTRAALLHVMGDLLGSVAALLAGLVIYFTGWTPIDPMLSLAIGALILFSSLRLLREALHGLMEGAPFDIAPDEVGRRWPPCPGAVGGAGRLYRWGEHLERHIPCHFLGSAGHVAHRHHWCCVRHQSVVSAALSSGNQAAAGDRAQEK